MNKPKLSNKVWISIILFSLFGQIAWVVENMYFNIFIFQEFQATSDHIALMVSLSAIAATVTTLFMGALSDKVGKRKIFIVAGYILWGLSIISFALLKKDILSHLFPYANSIILGISLVIVFDCVMTFFGSTANDAALNAWITDSTHEGNRGKVEGFLSSLPLVAVLVVFGGFMGLTANRQWSLIFVIIGSAVLLVGILGIFLIKDTVIQKPKDTYFKNIFYGFRLSVVKKHQRLYYLFLCYAVFGIAVQIFMPYLIIYYQYRLGLDQYVLIFAPAILLASAVTIFYGRYLDRVKFQKAVIIAIVMFMVGQLMLVFAVNTIFVFLATFLMLSGNLSVAACFGAAIRNHTPVEKVGLFQGLRMVSYVLIPMLIGPWIGSFVIRTTESIVGDDGVLVKVPTSSIFFASFLVTIILLVLAWGFRQINQKKYSPLYTEEGESLDKDNPLSEYPRPQLVRSSYISLHGIWDYERVGKVTQNGTICVPFPIGSSLSGVKDPLKPQEVFKYFRTFHLPSDFINHQTFIHLDGIDQFADVYLNKVMVGSTNNAYLPFVFDITDCLQEKNTLEIIVRDPLDQHYPYGKQSHRPGGIWYTATSGIWKSIWIESVPKTYLKAVSITPRFDSHDVFFVFDTNATQITVQIPEINETYHTSNKELLIHLPEVAIWTPNHPVLHAVYIQCDDDLTQSYFAMRKVSIQMKGDIPVISLNNQPIFLSGVLDQGYVSDGLFTPASYQIYQEDIQTMKDMGFNILRKHIKIEPLRFYYECDRLGMLVWQDMVNNGSYHFFKHTLRPMMGFNKVCDGLTSQTAPYLNIFQEAMIKTIGFLYNSPSIILWTIYNEGWGQVEADKMYEVASQLDPTRLIDTTSGWFHQHKSDVVSLHIYFKPVVIKAQSKPTVLSEFGGYSLHLSEHVSHTKAFGYRIKKTPKELDFDIEKLYINEIIPAIKAGLAACIYTQLSDVEEEVNGLITFDRKVIKVKVETMRKLNEKLTESFNEASS